MVRYQNSRKYGELLISVHDELMVLVPERHKVSEMKILRESMDGLKLDAPLVSDGSMGYKWCELVDCD